MCDKGDVRKVNSLFTAASYTKLAQIDFDYAIERFGILTYFGSLNEINWFSIFFIQHKFCFMIARNYNKKNSRKGLKFCARLFLLKHDKISEEKLFKHVKLSK